MNPVTAIYTKYYDILTILTLFNCISVYFKNSMTCVLMHFRAYDMIIISILIYLLNLVRELIFIIA